MYILVLISTNNTFKGIEERKKTKGGKGECEEKIPKKKNVEK